MILSVTMALLLCLSGTGFARVSGLPDFNGLVEEAVPAVVNIRVTQFGDRVTPDANTAEISDAELATTAPLTWEPSCNTTVACRLSEG